MEIPRIQWIGDSLPPNSLASLRDFIAKEVSFRRAGEILSAYQELRQRSILGQVFRIANGLHDLVDTAVVIGVDDQFGPPAVLKHACCDPYRELMSRAQRGSKPRMFFCNALNDNDACDAVLQRIAAGCELGCPAEKWSAIVAVDPTGACSQVANMLMHCVDALRKKMGNVSDSAIAPMVIPITCQDGDLWQWAKRFGCPQIIPIDSSTEVNTDAFGPTALLPAAILGLDCVRYLAGAELFFRHCCDPNARDVAWMPALERGFRLHSEAAALHRLSQWWDSIQCHQRVSDSPGWLNARIDSVRADVLPVVDVDYDSSIQSLKTMPELAVLAAEQWEQQQVVHNKEFLRVTVSQLDTYSMGQFFQLGLMMRTIATRNAATAHNDQ